MTAGKSMSPLTLSEAHIQRSCDDWLALDGWRAIITDPPQLRGLGVTEPGICDRLYIRYELQTLPPTREKAAAQVLWVEYKKKGGKAGQHQKDWHYIERMVGALVWVAGADFEPSIEAFQRHYRASGLMRRRI